VKTIPPATPTATATKTATGSSTPSVSVVSTGGANGLSEGNLVGLFVAGVLGAVAAVL